MALNQISQLVYISRTLIAPDEVDLALKDIAHVAHILNRQNNITGALAVVEGYFVQLLEGAPAALDLLMIHIEFDARHTDIEIIAREAVTHRSIPDWGMIAVRGEHGLASPLAHLLKTRPKTLAPWREALVKSVVV